jgi:sulfur-carrier protein adenylyltransferase/sulfurtransferase
MKEITVQELKQLKDNSELHELIDVREEYEYETANIGGKLIPMGEVAERISEIPKDKKVIVHCRSGKRSATVIQFLETQHGYTNLHNLKGGILAWIQEIDSSLPTS